MSKARQGTRKRVPPQKYAFLWRLMADAVISSPAKVVATTLLLKFHNTKTGRCNPSIGALTKTTGLSRRTIFYAVTELRDAGWVAVQSTGGGSPTHTNKYSFDFGGVRSTAPPTSAQDAPLTGANGAPMHEMPSTGAQFAHEPLRTTHPSGGWGGEEISLRRAPDGAAAEFEELRQLWQRPYGTNVAKALAAFNRVTGDDVSPELILESARRWVAAREPAFLPALERWLDDGAWRNEPPARQSNGHHKPSAAEVAARLARGEGGGW
jgi:hypothetical protein